MLFKDFENGFAQPEGKKRKNGFTQKIDPKRFESDHKKKLLYDQKYQRNTVN